jgi:hypothetical protein
VTGKRCPAKETLDTATFEMAVLGGTVLGGGGGRLETGLRLGQLAAELGDAPLIDVESLPARADLVAVATLSTIAGDETPYRLVHHKRAIQLLAANIETDVASLVNCGSGVVDTMVGWARETYRELEGSTCHPACIRIMFLLPADKEVSLSNDMIRLYATTPRWVTALRAI